MCVHEKYNLTKGMMLHIASSLPCHYNYLTCMHSPLLLQCGKEAGLGVRAHKSFESLWDISNEDGLRVASPLP